MVADSLLVSIAVVQGYLFWLIGELISFASYEGALSPAFGNSSLGWYGLAKHREAHHCVMDQRELTAEILSL